MPEQNPIVAICPADRGHSILQLVTRDGAVHDVDGLLGLRGLDEPAAVFLADQGYGEPLHYGQRSPRLNVIASKGRMLTASSSFAHPISTHSPSRNSNASNVRSVGSMSHR